jgi:hypothetical protein
MNVLFISGAHLSRPLAYEAGVLKKVLDTFMGVIENRQKFLDKVGFGNDFDGRLLDEEAAGYVFWFEQRSIDEIIVGLRHFGDKWSADYLEDWKRGPGDELEGRIQMVLREERLAAFRKLVDLLLRLNPDKKPPTIPLDDWFIWLLDRRYLGRWWASCRDDLGLDDRTVYMPEGDIKKKRSGGRGQSRGGYARRHGRPPDPINSAPNAPPSRTPPPATTTLCPPGADEGVAGPVDVLKDLPRNHVFALSGLSATGNASPLTAKSGIPKSSELSVSNPANLSS